MLGCTALHISETPIMLQTSEQMQMQMAFSVRCVCSVINTTRGAAAAGPPRSRRSDQIFGTLSQDFFLGYHASRSAPFSKKKDPPGGGPPSNVKQYLDLEN